jgi:iron(III) transport system ATP-binding protein
VLDGGRIQQVDTPEVLLQRPASPFVAHFLSDATLVDGFIADGRFHAAGHPLSVPSPTSLVGTAEACAAVLPSAVQVTAHPHGAATIRSSLFTPTGSDLVVDWEGLSLRARMVGMRPRVGDSVNVDVAEALIYPTVPSALAAEPAPMPI